jgi:hypothetical protein
MQNAGGNWFVRGFWNMSVSASCSKAPLPSFFATTKTVSKKEPVNEHGGPGDHPITDLIYYGNNTFPPDIAALIRQLHSLDPNMRNTFALDAYNWVEGRELEQGRARLEAELGRIQE